MIMSELKLSKEKVSVAVGALLQLENKSEKTALLEKVEDVQLQICIKKIPSKEKLIKLNLPNSLRHEDLDVCLFVKDLDRGDSDYEPTVSHFQDLLRKHGVDSVSEIIPLKSLKTEYKPFEAKRNLSNAYDVFLADARIIRLLPTYLGKFFYGRKRQPIQVNMMSKHLKYEINKAVGSSKCQISEKGPSNLAKVGTAKLSQGELVDNILAAVTQIVKVLPGGSDNIKQLSVKTDTSTSIPIYLSAGGPQDVLIPRERRLEAPEAEDLSTLMGAKVKVFPSGRIKVIKDGEADTEETGSAKRHSKRKTVLKRKKRVMQKKTAGSAKKKAAGSAQKKAAEKSTKTKKEKTVVEETKPPKKKRKVVS